MIIIANDDDDDDDDFAVYIVVTGPLQMMETVKQKRKDGIGCYRSC